MSDHVIESRAGRGAAKPGRTNAELDARLRELEQQNTDLQSKLNGVERNTSKAATERYEQSKRPFREVVGANDAYYDKAANVVHRVTWTGEVIFIGFFGHQSGGFHNVNPVAITEAPETEPAPLDDEYECRRVTIEHKSLDAAFAEARAKAAAMDKARRDLAGISFDTAHDAAVALRTAAEAFDRALSDLTEASRDLWPAAEALSKFRSGRVTGDKDTNQFLAALNALAISAVGRGVLLSSNPDKASAAQSLSAMCPHPERKDR